MIGAVIAVLVCAGLLALVMTRAAGPFVGAEAESGSIAGSAYVRNDANASGGSAVQFAPPPPPPSGSGIITLTFDDGQLGQYNNARPVLMARGLPATFYFISDAFGYGGSSMNTTQARQLINDGFEAGNHTKSHPNLTTLSASGINGQFSTAQSVINTVTGRSPTTCAYPFGSYNGTVDAEARKFFRSCRGTGQNDNNPASMNVYNLGAYMMGSSYNASSVAAMAARAKANNSWIILLYHGIGPSASLDTDTATFTAQMDAIKNSGVRVMTMGQALTALGR